MWLTHFIFTHGLGRPRLEQYNNVLNTFGICCQIKFQYNISINYLLSIDKSQKQVSFNTTLIKYADSIPLRKVCQVSLVLYRVLTKLLHFKCLSG